MSEKKKVDDNIESLDESRLESHRETDKNIEVINGPHIASQIHNPERRRTTCKSILQDNKDEDCTYFAH